MMEEEYEPMDISETYNDELEEPVDTNAKVPFPVVETPTIDLENYISSYTDRTKIDRLELIAQRSPPLAIEAYKMAIHIVKSETRDTRKYIQLCRKLNELLTSRHSVLEPVDTDWIESTQCQGRIDHERLETELRNYKNTCIKESIRMGQNDLGDNAYQSGDFVNALKYYSRARDYCSSSKHVLSMCLNIIKVSMCIYDFSHVMSHVTKAHESEPNLPHAIECRIKLCSALAALNGRKYKKVAQDFQFVAYSYVSQCTDICTANDVAMYAGLCAMATLDRDELKRFLENENVRLYLELEPQLREILRSFYQAHYAQCLKSLASYKNDLYLFLHLHTHVDELYGNIRQRILFQYFLPYSTVELVKMACTLNCSLEELENELAVLIQKGQLEAKIDGHRKLLQRHAIDHRGAAFKKAIEEGDVLIIQNHLLQLKLNMAQQGLVLAPQE